MTGAIVHVVEDMRVAGMERAVQTFALLAKAAGLGVKVVCTSSGGDIADELEGQGVPVERLEDAGVRETSRAVAAAKPFVVHTHGAARVVGRLAARLAGAEGVVHHLHGTQPFGLKQRLFELALPADAYLACSEFVRRDFQRQAGVAEVEVLHNAVDAQRFRFSEESRQAIRAELGVGEQRPIIASVGRLVPDKGQAVLLDALASVLSERPDALLVVVGDGVGRAELESSAARFGDAVRFVGVREDVAALLCACDVYAQPSIRREGLGLAALEALACERAVVASAVEGLGEAVGDAGVLVPPGNVDALASAILELLAQPQRRASLGRRGRERVVARFSTELVGEKLLAVYRRILGGPGR